MRNRLGEPVAFLRDQDVDHALLALLAQGFLKLAARISNPLLPLLAFQQFEEALGDDLRCFRR